MPKNRKQMGYKKLALFLQRTTGLLRTTQFCTGLHKAAQIGCCFLAVLFAASAQVNVTTFHNDDARDGQNLNETILTPANVTASQFGQIFVQPVDGYIYAQPLYISNLEIGGVSHNVVYVATEHDSVYAFDADSNLPPLWHVSFINPSAGITTVGSQSDLDCSDISPEVGITGSPVIDTSSNTLYVVVNTKENGVFFQRLHALDITTGAEKFGGPVAIQATVPGTGDGNSGGQLAFDPKWANQRPGLLLQNGLVYITWASHCDVPPFHGWMMTYNAQTLRQTAVWNATPNGSDGGVWQSGAPPAADSSGYVYLGVGNGTFDLNTGGHDTGDSILKFGPPSSGSIPLLDYFTPYNQATLAAGDTDLGSGGVILLPDQPLPRQHLLIEIGKQGSLYLVNRDSMGHFNSTGDTQIVQWIIGLVGGLWGTPAFWNNTLYLGGANDALQAFPLYESGMLQTSPSSASPESFDYPGTTPSISANGNTNGIVWALEEESNSPAVLHAYEATNLSNELYNTSQGGQLSPGPRVKFAVPTIANGKVYVGTATQLAVYGLFAGRVMSPVDGIELSNTSNTFSWAGVSGATGYQLSVGTSLGGTNIFNGVVTGTSQTVNFIPCTGGAIYVQLAAEVNGTLQTATNYTYACKNGIGDFNGDAHQDLVWQNNTNGQVNVNYYGGSTPQSQGSTVLDNGTDLAGWKLVGAADFNRDGVPDLVYQNTTTAQVNVNYSGGGTACLSCGIDTTGWQVVAVADFNGDGVPDLVYQNTATGQVNVDYYGGAGGSQFIGWACLSCGIDTTGWRLAAAADFDANGTPDLVYQNTGTGQVNVDYYGGAGGAVFQGWACLSCGVDTTGWLVVGAMDFNADGVPDLVYENTASNQVNVNFYGGSKGSSFEGWACLNCGTIQTGVVVGAVAKYGANGEADLVWQNSTTNAVTLSYYTLGGAAFQGWACLSCGIDNTNWKLVGTGDFDGNGVPDLVYQNTQTAQVNVTYYGGAGGTTVMSTACLSCGIDTTQWQVIAVADFNGDGVPDLIYQNTQSGQVNVDYYGGTGGAQFTGWACLSCGIDTANWRAAAAADFDGNGVPDLIYQNTQTGQVNVDYYGGVGGSKLIGWACLSCGIDTTGWQVVGASDFDGNGVPDLVYQNQGTGQLNVDYYGGAGGAKFMGWNALEDFPGWSVIVPRAR
jgi:hypothetical protein